MPTPEDSLWLDRTVTVAAAQFAPGLDVRENLADMARFVEVAAHRRAALVVFPEYAACFGRRLDDEVVARAEPLDGPFVTGLAELARAHHVHLVAGLAEAAPDIAPRVHNTLVALSPDGDLEAVYRKVHLFDTFGHHESRRVTPGPLAPAQIFEVSGIAVGLQAGYDLRFPELTRGIISAGAELVAVPAQWAEGSLKELHWRTLLQARAIESTAYLLAAGQPVPHGIGRSMIVDPMGVILSATGAEPGLVVAEISLQRLAQVRATNPALLGRRIRVATDPE
jgi:predicted amidohydrolase